ncbi:cation:proton antiporter [Actinospongicola halichondriae]|uniref:cation:proton antiporter n=1 Tax=Actinospongicola halichondriae TaxID=3236844 RepID=UPI003D4BFF3A
MIIDPGLILASADSDLGVGLAAIVVFGVGAQLLASRIQVPAILLLLLGGVLAGPVLEIVDPDELLGDLLFPAVSLAVGILLFEGGLGLRWAELEHHGRGPIIRLITLGVLVTWIIGGVAAFVLIDVDRNGAILLGAILVVSGPTVVLPLIRFARVREPVNGILRWEGIFIDPVGATLAIVVLDAVIENEGTQASFERVLTTAAAGTVGGLLGAAILTLLFNRHWVPDNLHNPFTLAMVVGAFAAADLIQPEAGLFATTVMGVALANQRWAPIAHIREFEENLGSLILAGLFIVLGARVDLDLLLDYLPESIALSAILIVIARPAAVYLSTVGSGLTFVERAYLACMSPRGIVAAAVSALFAIELEEAGQPVEALAPVTFIVIVTTVLFSAIASRVGARRFRVARPAPRGVAFIGGPDWALDLAAWLSDHEIPTLVITTDPFEVDAATSRGVLSYQGTLDSEDLLMAMESVGIRQVVGVSRFQEVNTLVIDRATEAVGRANVYFLPRYDDAEGGEPNHAAVMARRPFGRDATQVEIERLAAFDWHVTAVSADTFDRPALEGAIPLLSIDDDGPTVLTTRPEKAPADGVIRVYLTGPDASGNGAPTQGSGGSEAP